MDAQTATWAALEAGNVARDKRRDDERDARLAERERRAALPEPVQRTVQHDALCEAQANALAKLRAALTPDGVRAERKSAKARQAQAGNVWVRPGKRERQAARDAIAAANVERERMLPLVVKGRKAQDAPHVHVPSMDALNRIQAGKRKPGNGQVEPMQDRRAVAFGLLQRMAKVRDVPVAEHLAQFPPKEGM